MKFTHPFLNIYNPHQQEKKVEDIVYDSSVPLKAPPPSEKSKAKRRRDEFEAKQAQGE